MSEIYKRERSVTKAFAHYGIGDYTRKETRITARLPNTNEARLLELPPSQPLLVTESVNIDAERRPIVVGCGRMAAQPDQLIMQSYATSASPPRTPLYTTARLTVVPLAYKTARELGKNTS